MSPLLGQASAISNWFCAKRLRSSKRVQLSDTETKTTYRDSPSLRNSPIKWLVKFEFVKQRRNLPKIR